MHRALKVAAIVIVGYAALALILGALTSFQAIAEQDKPHSQRWTVVNYWSITCAPCRIEIPELNLLSKELDAVDIGLVGINFDEDNREKTLMLAERMGIEFPTLHQEQVDSLSVSPPNVLPTTLILSPDGVEMARLIGAQTRASIKVQLGQLIGSAQ